jgi:hypothetical protein
MLPQGLLVDQVDGLVMVLTCIMPQHRAKDFGMGDFPVGGTSCNTVGLTK